MATTPAAGDAGHEREWRYRMKELCDLTGLPRQAIHFYIQQGLVPPGRKTGRNMAYYGQVHVDRLKLIRTLQHERFLPLKAIRALLNDQDQSFSPSQRQFLKGVKTRLAQSIAARPDRPETVDAEELLVQLALDRSELDRMLELDMLVTQQSEDGRTLIAKDDIWMLEFLSQLRAIGLTADLGFDVSDLAFYEEAITQLFDRERVFLQERLSELPPEQVGAMIERAIPVVHAFLVRYHEAKIRAFVADL
ncbi:MAG: MerR family transcriptional regulator [Myxococcota bacterium]